ncbi:MAG TPA: peptidylprolyl isomerase [Spirochaetia bacterium]|nr:peptidylprolyl isomerase [Spirochaetia bacterium]
MAPKQRTTAPAGKTTPQKKDPGVNRRRGIWIFSFIILVVIVVTFIGAPVVSRNGGGNKLSFGSYDGHDITYSQGNYLDHQKNLIVQRMRDSGQDASTATQIYQVWRQAFMNTAFHEAVMIEAQKSGLTVSENAVDAQIAQDPQFLQNGAFSPQLYQQDTNADKFRLRGYLRQQLIQQQFVDDELSGIHMSDAAVSFVSSMASPERRFNLVSFAYADFPDSKVVEYGKANPKKFQRINLSVITVRNSESEANAVYKQLENKTASFEDLARAHSTDMYADKGGDLGWTSYYELATDFSDPTVLDKVFSLPAGQISSVLKTTYGWVIYRVNDPAQQPDLTNKDTLKTVRDYMTSFERGIIEDYLVAEANGVKKSAETDSLDAAAAAVRKSVGATDYFPINYGNEPLFAQVKAITNEPISSAATREDFFQKLFSLKKDAISEPIVIGDSVAIFQFADGRNAPEKTVSTIKTNVPYALQQFQSQEVQRGVFDTNLLVDNFNKIYAQYIYQPSSNSSTPQ